MAKHLSTLIARLTKEQLRKLKSGGSVNVKPSQVGEDGDDEIKVSHIKHKKMAKNHSKSKAYRLSLSGDEEVNGEGVHAVGNLPLHTIKVPSNKILTPKVYDTGRVAAGIDRTPTASYNTFIKGSHPASSPLIPMNLDQSRPSPVVYGTQNPRTGRGVGGYGVGSPMNPRIPRNLDQSVR